MKTTAILDGVEIHGVKRTPRGGMWICVATLLVVETGMSVGCSWTAFRGDVGAVTVDDSECPLIVVDALRAYAGAAESAIWNAA